VIIAPFLERTTPLPHRFRATVVARDPSVKDPRATDAGHRMLRAEVDFPASRLEPGPRGARFHVIDFDASRKVLTEPTDFTPASVDLPLGWNFTDEFKGIDDAALLASAAFRAQHVYAVAARTLSIFEFALGRPVPWAFPSPHLNLVPMAFEEANAYYSDDDQALFFGYFPTGNGRTVYTCLAHDIVAHEVTHAILDGLRSRFDTPSLPDQAGFHEGFADLVGLLSILSSPESMTAVLGGTDKRVKASEVTYDALRHSVLVTIGREFGDALHLNRGGGLRRSVRLRPTKAWKDPKRLDWEEPHRRGEILVAAVLQTFLQIWTQRLEALAQADTLDRARTAEEGASAAKHILEMAIRAIDYCPPVEFEFEDFLAAMLTSDAEVVPDDQRGYRTALTESFAAFGIEPAIGPPVVIGAGAERPSYRNFSYAALRSDPDEAFRFMWDNAGLINLATRYYTHVDSVRPSVRVGPNGFVVGEWLVDYVQELIITAAELEQLARQRVPSFQVPVGILPETQLKIWGGGTLVFDEFGGLKYHQFKRLDEWERQQRRLDFLVRRGLWDSKGRLGFGLGIPLGQRFAMAHTPTASIGEEW
jgi:hypothetical protein